MSESTEINIKKLIVHILDNSLDIPVLSEDEHPKDDDITDFVQKHIIRLFNDGALKPAFFNNDNRIKSICESLRQSYDGFIDYTKDMSSLLFQILKTQPDIPSGDMMFSIFDYEKARYLGIFKLNYKASYIHFVNQFEDKTVNSIIKQKTSLPNEKQKIDECILINLDTLNIQLMEKKYEIDGEKRFYLSELFLHCESKKSEKEKIKILKKTTQDFIKTYYEDDFEKMGTMKKAVSESLKADEVVDVERVADNLFKTNPELKNEYVKSVEEKGLEEKAFQVSEKNEKRNFRKQKLVTDTGIEINLPVELFNDSEKVEFINNPDGTISIMLKNIGSVKDK
ncbi:nucleoid-associated protein [Sporosalibacterium faouarense]|uniref:nucleoid-associated protein n=1 Tax=Sporosalibacterium faouarense TaxID=516123 RepID=UPI00141D1BAF|nr:nucleoid-associated protein [Sporosalibacterium faouarense]MTI48232.1 nucleoid-associated protein [Bacillota bacterium]